MFILSYVKEMNRLQDRQDRLALYSRDLNPSDQERLDKLEYQYYRQLRRTKEENWLQFDF
jgi:hypothetical protein